ncbi:MAG: hypothetical protein BRD31_06795 [Bacteroidetes bacterium QH_2_64_26]|nr:MAG: hypothetical protein BRD31_06795 [Bacteroidetes bacterium QH_2_64_26]
MTTTVLTGPVEEHASETYLLTGGVALDYEQVAVVLGAATNRDLEYVAESLAEYQRAGGETASVNLTAAILLGLLTVTTRQWVHAGVTLLMLGATVLAFTIGLPTLG